MKKIFPRFSCAATLCAALAFAVSGANAATDTWIGNSSTDWANAVNWGDTAPISGDSLVFGVEGASGATLTNTLTNSTFNIAGITFNSGASAYTMGGNAFSLSGNITNNSTSLETLNQPITLAGTTTITTTSGGGDITLSGINSSSGGLIIAGAGTTTLVAPTDADWTLPSATSVSNGSTLKLQFQSAPTDFRQTYPGAITVNSGGVLNLNAVTTTIDDNYMNAGSVAGSGTIIKTGTGYVDFFGAVDLSAFNGLFDVQAGTLGFNTGAVGVQESGSATLQLSGSTALLDIRTGTLKIDALNGVAGSQVSVSYTDGGTLSLGNNNGSGAFAGSLTNGGSALSVIKNGSGTETLTGTNTYSGGTTISGGTLQTGNASALGTGAVTVSGGTLQVGDGTVNSLTGIGGLTLNAAASVLDLKTNSGSVSLASGKNFTMSLGTWKLNNNSMTTGSNVVQITLSGGGTYSLTGGTIDLSGFTDSAVSGTYQIIAGTGSASGLSFTGGQVGASYSIDNAGDLVVIAVPEPSTLALVGIFGFGILLLFRRRRSA